MSKNKFGHLIQLSVLFAFVAMALACASSKSATDGDSYPSSGSSDGSAIEVPSDSIMGQETLMAME